MGTFVFKWAHPGQEVYVTGTFDDWSKSEKLDKVGDVFEKNVTLASADEKIYYKFVVDGNWVTDHTAPQENDASGNLNNVLTTDRILKHTPETAGLLSSTGPSATTAGLAGAVPLEKNKEATSDLPGAFPETPAGTDKGDFSVNPLPAFAGAVNPVKLAPGEPVPDPATLTSNTVTSNVKNDPELVAADKAASGTEPTFGVSPLPAFPGAVNPVTVAPGEALPETNTLTGNTVSSGVTLDKESYEKSGGIGNAPVLPPVVTPEAERQGKGAGVLDLPPASGLIPESSLPMGDAAVGSYAASPVIQSAGAQSTTAQLAGAVPLESSKTSGTAQDSEADNSQKDLPTTAGEAAAAVGGAALAVGGAAVAYLSGAATTVASSLPPSVTSKLPQSLQDSIGSANASSVPEATTAAKDTPEIVKESIAESGQAPEAASNEQAVLQKSAVEKELLTGDAQGQTSTIAKDTPEVVQESIAQAGQTPEAVTNEQAVKEKAAVEQELLKQTKPVTSTGESAPGRSSLAAALSTPRADSRDVSPGTVPGSRSQNKSVPTVTSGVASGSTAPVTPAKDAPATPAKPTTKSDVDSPSTPTTDKKNKRRSFFGKIKDKLSHKDK